ncbi:acyltransferase [Gemmata sp. G18]|uniref:Acyltransferase n=1 Tax=Gemmata palustris TaxID=2822762 RepID=A0ABS5BXU7_9BACT|nr:acyltransferase [Gemmata palustris]MBP3958070.1 acyltransferase [Gemmata palustris]
MRSAWRPVASGECAGVLTLTAGFRPTGELPWDKFRAVNLAFWTLAIEVQFYAVVWVAVRAGRWFYPLLGAVTVASLPFAASETAFSSGWFLPFWPFFALGIGLYAALECGALSVPHPSVLFLAHQSRVAVRRLATAPLMPDGSQEMIASEFAFAVGLTTVLWGIWRSTEGALQLAWGAAVLVYLGAVSYSVYLLHIPLMLLAGHAVAIAFLPGSSGFLAATVTTVCVLVYPFYRYIERPFMVSTRRSIPEARRGRP